MKRYLTATEAAKLIGVNKATVTRWIKKGLIDGATRPQGARFWRIPLESYVKLKTNHL